MTAPSAFDAWNYRSSAGYVEGNDLVGYKIAARDGDIGKVDEATYDVGAAKPGGGHRTVDLRQEGCFCRPAW